MKKFFRLAFWRARCIFARRKKIKNQVYELTKDLGVVSYSTIIGMDGIPKQEGYVLVQAKPKSRWEKEFHQLMWADTPQEIVQKLQNSL